MRSALDIVRVMPFFMPALRYGGCVSQAGAICAHLAQRGHRLRVITSDLGQDADHPRDRWVERDGYHVYYATARRWQRRPPYPAPAFGTTLHTALASTDLLCMNVGLTLLNAKARKLAQAHGLPYVYNAEGALCQRRLMIKGLAKRCFLQMIERPILRDATALQAVTHKEAGDLIALGASADRIHVIPNGVELASGDGDNSAEHSLRRRLGLSKDTTVMLFFGRLHKIKGLELLLDVCTPLLKNRRDLHLVLAGPDDGSKSGIETKVRENNLQQQVHLPGLLIGAARRRALQDADLFVLTSQSEGLPLAALEAAAEGLPLVLSDACNLPEVTEFAAGRVADLDANRLRANLHALIADPAERARCATNAIRMVAERFAIGAVVDQLETLYTKVARR